MAEEDTREIATPDVKELREIKVDTKCTTAEQYLTAGVHIGTQFKLEDMADYIHKRREDGLFVLDVSKIDERLYKAAQMLAKFEPSKVVVIASRAYAQQAATKLGQLTGMKVIAGRYYPGTFTNPNQPTFFEPDAVFVADPVSDHQAVDEAFLTGKPVVGICDTNTPTGKVDFIIPGNNRGKKSLALLFWILAKEYMKVRGTIPSDAAFNTPIDDFLGRAIQVFRPPDKKALRRGMLPGRGGPSRPGFGRGPGAGGRGAGRGRGGGRGRSGSRR